ncbi:hypothetical protein CKO23_03940 [Thiocystis violacea]|nr:hypothetical protein [Thiocystis violacea]
MPILPVLSIQRIGSFGAGAPEKRLWLPVDSGSAPEPAQKYTKGCTAVPCRQLWIVARDQE